jgi:adenylate kinase
MSLIELSDYAEKKSLILENDTERDTKIVDLDAFRKSLKEDIYFYKNSIIVDGHYSHELLNEDQVTCIFVFRRAPWQLIEEYNKRRYSQEKIWENLEAEIIGVIASEVLEKFSLEIIHEIDTTNKTPNETTQELLMVMEEKKVKNYGPIDWITCPKTLGLLVNKTCILS